MKGLGGFPPLILKKVKKAEKEGELQRQYFSESLRSNVNIKEILNSEDSNILNELDINNDIVEVERVG